jgi:hypothetical protein
MLDITDELFMSFCFGSFGMKLVFCEELVDELPIGAIGYFFSTDGTEFREISL